MEELLQRVEAILTRLREQGGSDDPVTIDLPRDCPEEGSVDCDAVDDLPVYVGNDLHSYAWG